MRKPVSIGRLKKAIQALPSDDPRVYPKKWYTTQKEHWLGWLSDYHGPGAYGRRPETRRDAEYVYNHVVEVSMLLWLYLFTAEGSFQLALCAVGVVGYEESWSRGLWD